MTRTQTRAEPKQARARFTVGAILEAAERLLATGGRTNTRAIARLAGVSVGTLYQYFPGRDAVIARVVGRRQARDERVLLEVFERHRGGSILALMRHSLDAMLPRSDWELALYPSMVDNLQAVERHAQVQAFLARFEALWSGELEQRRDELRPGLDPTLAAVTSIHALRGAMLALARREPALPRAQLVDILADLGATYLTG